MGRKNYTGGRMYIYRWRHSTAFSSWSVMDELRIYNNNYTSAEVLVLAKNKDEAIRLLAENGNWNVEDLRAIEPEIISLDQTRIVYSRIE